MNTQPQIFDFQEHSVRVVEGEQGEPWFVAKDVSELLGYRDAHNAVRNLDDDEKGTQKMSTLRGVQELAVINESGLYTLIVRSNKPEAKKFRKWVTSEVLPAIRKTGRYDMSGKNVKPPITIDQLGIPAELVGRIEIDGDRVVYHLDHSQPAAAKPARPNAVGRPMREILLEVAVDSRLSSLDCAVFTLMTEHCDEVGLCHISRAKIGAEYNVTVAQVSHARARLVKAGWLRKEGGGKHVRYFIATPKTLSA